MGDQQRTSLFLCVAVDDLDAAIARVQAAGGRAEQPTDEPWGRIAECRDPDDTEFALYQLTAGDRAETTDPSGPGRPVNGLGQGDLAYITIETIDSVRTRAFYGDVLGWEYQPGHVEDGWGVVDSAPMVGMHGGHASVAIVPMYRVDDIETAVAQVRAAGGTSTDPAVQPYGISAECVDDQGTRFYLGQL
jgi:predicted enzyme related to lactoylglutathione lyase